MKSNAKTLFGIFAAVTAFAVIESPALGETVVIFPTHPQPHVVRPPRPVPPPIVRPPVVRPPRPVPPIVRPVPPPYRPVPPIVRPPRPVPPIVRPLPPVRPPQDRYSDLRGYCNDYREFEQAKDFAYRSSGLNYSTSQATYWAQEYLSTHACGTIYEFSRRFNELFEYAYNSSYMNQSTTWAREYALPRAEYMQVEETQYWKAIFREIHEFVYNSSYLNSTSSRAIEAGREWNERGYCGDFELIERIKSDYRYHFDFAYSSRGLNYSSSEARRYALGQITNYTQCMDLFY